MSHAFAIVLVRPAADLATEVDALLAPFSEHNDEEGEEHDPNRYWWDWYRVGGRWDGLIRGSHRGTECAHCAAEGGFGRSQHHYSNDHAQISNNSIPVVEMGEVQPFTLVTPGGQSAHRAHFVPSPDRLHFPWKYEDNPEFDRWAIEQLLAHRDCIAVGIDYHS